MTAIVHHMRMAEPVNRVVLLLSKSIRSQHQPAMPWALVPAFYAEQLHRSDGLDLSRQVLAFLILTAARSGEVRYMTWAEVDLKAKVWTVPADRMKARQVHRVPLSAQAVGILRQQQGLHQALVFPSIRDRTALSDMALTAFLRRAGAVSDVTGRVATAHGFRSSFRDWCSEKGYARDLAERSLAHTVQNKVEAAYHRTDLLEQRRPLMQSWADHVTSGK
jgi:integrase